MNTRVLRRSQTQAFTLIELLLVLVILAVLAAVVVPKFTTRTEQARITAAKTQISTFKTALGMFELDNGRYPSSEDGLRALVRRPEWAKPENWKSSYLENKGDVPLDPWGNAYVYRYPSSNDPTGYDLYSLGPDGREGNDDVSPD
jgi:general secretion pathway protein G